MIFAGIFILNYVRLLHLTACFPNISVNTTTPAPNKYSLIRNAKFICFHGCCSFGNIGLPVQVPTHAFQLKLQAGSKKLFALYILFLRKRKKWKKE